ncbi:MAG: PIN domain-containing protein, partial [Chloroflexota bacterium]
RYAGRRDLIPAPVQRWLNREQLGVSPFTRLELAYLYEIGRVRTPAQVVIGELGPSLELVVADAPVALVCEAALDLTWTRDPFDRLLCAQATATSLVTKDETIRRHLPLAWWAE